MHFAHIETHVYNGAVHIQFAAVVSHFFLVDAGSYIGFSKSGEVAEYI